MQLPLYLPTLNRKVIISIYDSGDKGVSQTKIIGTLTLKLEDIQKGVHKKPYWFNIYGTNNEGTEYAKIMN